MLTRSVSITLSALSLAAAHPSLAQAPPSPATLISAQQEAMKPLGWMDGVWRGPAWTILQSGVRHAVTQTERIGPFLDASVKLLEGRGYDSAGKVTFNAFGVISYDPLTKAYTLHSYAQGRSGDFPIVPTADGYVWEIPAGPAKIRYTAVIKDGAWREIGERIVPGREPMQFFEMNLKRIADSAWPGSGTIPMTGLPTQSTSP